MIVHGYKQWGVRVLDRLNGMFGIALWDAPRRRLILARDPMGIKLVYYRIADGTVHFGSEIRAILAALPERPAVDTAGLHDLLVYGYVPSPRTLYAGIRKLAPGTMAVFEDGRARVERWYTFAPDADRASHHGGRGGRGARGDLQARPPTAVGQRRPCRLAAKRRCGLGTPARVDEWGRLPVAHL